jgi:hypothetical protein
MLHILNEKPSFPEAKLQLPISCVVPKKFAHNLIVRLNLQSEFLIPEVEVIDGREIALFQSVTQVV